MSVNDDVERLQIKRFLLGVGFFVSSSPAILILAVSFLIHYVLLPVVVQTHRPFPAITDWLVFVCPLPGDGAILPRLAVSSVVPYLALRWLLRRSKSIAANGAYFAGWAAAVLCADVFFVCFAVAGFGAPYTSIVEGIVGIGETPK